MAHTRGPGTQPEFITTLVEQIAGLFGWPWHGLERLATAGGRTTETPSGEFATKGTSPESVNYRAFNLSIIHISRSLDICSAWRNGCSEREASAQDDNKRIERRCRAGVWRNPCRHGVFSAARNIRLFQRSHSDQPGYTVRVCQPSNRSY